MDFKEIQELIKLINKSSLTEFKMEDGDFKISIRTKKYDRHRNLAPQQQILSVPAAPLQSVQQPFANAPAAQVTGSSNMEAAASDLQSQQEAAANEENSSYIEVKSPIVGTFYRSPSPDKPAYVKVGDTIEEGSVVCVIEAMKLFNEIESEVGGKIVKIMVEDASPVEYDQVLYLVDPMG
ncbi:MAG: acetyl-CoA carboxylase biotin carboxyl carrier protein [Saprospiraceae bacterium]|jgi:acetyl-CoA carboxylase biotin carboxyl carrier protein